ncbi:MAG: tetratricopeptide repeat protein [Candidatus Kuenenia sp.]|nr:tetratricopeptide repeat protein [Candidatus Kuenenia sp.]
MTIYSNKKFLHILSIVILSTVSILTYLNCLPNQFVYDDNATIIDNHFIEDWRNLSVLFTHDYFARSGELTYRPVVTLSYFVDYSLWQSRPMGYHITNVVSHTINSMLVYFLIYCLSVRCFLPAKYPASQYIEGSASYINHAFLAALLFIMHPIVNETVNAISYREDLLATNFALLSFLLFLLSGKKTPSLAYLAKTKDHRRMFFSETESMPAIKHGIPVYIAAMTAYFLALLSKESAIVLPGLIFSFCLLFKERTENIPSPSLEKERGVSPINRCYAVPPEDAQNNSSKPRYWQNRLCLFFRTFAKIAFSPYFIGYIWISIMYLILRFIVFRNIHENIEYPGNSFLTALFTSTKVTGRYISNIFIPFNLNVDYHVLPIKSPLSMAFIVPFLFLTALIVIIIRLKRKRIFRTFKPQQCDKNSATFRQERFYFILFGLLWFFISLLPVINILPLSNLMADRYLYLPFIGCCIVFSTAITHQKKAIKYAFIIPVLIVCAIIAITRNRHWENEFTLWHNSAQNPLCSFTTYNNLGTQYNKKDDPDTALAYYNKAIEKSQETGFTRYATVHYNMGNAYKKKNLLPQAISSYKKALHIKLDYKQAHNNLGKIYFEMEQYDDAFDEYNTALAIDPGFADAHNNLGVLYNKRGMAEDAIAAYKRALAADPLNSDAYYNLGNVYESKNQFELAVDAYQSALAIDPELVYAHNNLGALYDKKGTMDKAIEEYRQAIKYNPLYPYAHNNLGASLAKKGDMDNALAEFQEAVHLLPDNPDFRFNLGYVFLRMGNNALALQAFEETIRMKPSHTEALFHAGVIHYEQGNKDRAETLLKEAIAISPGHLKIKKYLEMIENM